MIARQIHLQRACSAYVRVSAVAAIYVYRSIVILLRKYRLYSTGRTAMRLLSTAVGKKEKYVSFTIHRLCFGIVT